MSPKSKKISVVRTNEKKNEITGTSLVHDLLNSLAEEGTVESIKKLQEFIVNEENFDLRCYAELVLGDAQYCYYCPRNENEVKEFELAKLIREKQKEIERALTKIADLQQYLRVAKIKGMVHDKVIQKASKVKQEDWKYNWLEGYYCGERKELSELQDGMSYDLAWLEEARKMVTTKKYQNIPEEIFEHLRLDGEGSGFWTDEMSCPENNKFDVARCNGGINCHCDECSNYEDNDIQNEDLIDIPF